MQGWIKDYRKEVNSDIWMMPPLYHRVWQYLKYQVNHKENRIPMRDGSFMEIKAGQHLTSVRNIANGVSWYERGILKTPNPKTVDDILTWLEKNFMIQIDKGKGNRQYTLITLLNWDSYQGIDDASNSKVTVEKQSLDINKNDKNVKNEKKKDPYDEIKNLRLSYSSEINSLIDKYWEVVKKTRKTNQISNSVILKTMQQWKKFDEVVIEYSLKKHIEAYDDGERTEKYTLGIMRNTPLEQAADMLNRKNTTNGQGMNYQSQRDPRDKEIEFQKWLTAGNDPEEFNWSQ